MTTPVGPLASAQAARQPVLDAIATRLATLGPDRLHVHRGEVDGVPAPLLDAAGQPDPSGRVAPYAVVWGPTGRPEPTGNLAATVGGPQRLGEILLTGQITFAAGFSDDLLATLDLAVPLLQLWTPTIPGLSCGRLRQQIGTDAGPVRRDDQARPPRFYTPWLWTLHATSTSS